MANFEEDDDFLLIHATDSLKVAATIYNPLPIVDGKNYIRLVRLSPGLDAQQHIQVSLHIYDLDDVQCPAFRALSYAWHPPKDIHDVAQISCEGKVLDVTKALDVALRSQYRFDSEIQLYWIDEISINQADIEEKNRQVRLRHQILSKASQTVAWLGEGNHSTDHTFRILRRVIKSVATDDKMKAALWGKLRDSKADAVREILHAPIEEVREVIQLEDAELLYVEFLLRQKWFTRTWSIQEAVVSKKLVLACGQNEIDLDSFCTALFFVLPAAIRNKSLGLAGRTEWILMMRLRYGDRGDAVFYLDHLLRLTQYYGTVDPRDRLFVLYSLTSTKSETLPLAVDYNVEIAHLYAETTYNMFRTSDSLELLEVAGFESNVNKGLPSWAYCLSPNDASPDAGSLQPDIDTFLTVNERLLRAFFSAFLQNADDTAEEFGKRIEELMSLDHTEVYKNSEEGREDYRSRLPQSGATGDSKPILRNCDVLAGTITLDLQIFDEVAKLAKALPDVTVPQQLSDALMEDLYSGGVLRTITAPYRHALTRGYNTMAELRAQFNVWEEWDTFAARASYPTGEPILDAYRKTITAGFLTLPDPEAEEAFIAWRNLRTTNERFQELYRPSGPLLLTYGYRVLKNIYGKPDEFGVPPEVAHFATMVGPSLKRRLAWTKQGFLAILPPTAAIGDRIALLPGARLPFVLRPIKNNTFTVIGPCYVHGIMRGEAFDETACQKISLV